MPLESGNNRGTIEVTRMIETGNGQIEATVTFNDVRWKKEDDGDLWIIGADGPVATFAHGFWATVMVKEAVSA